MNLDLLDQAKPGVESFVETVLSNGHFFINRLNNEFHTRDSSGTIIDHVITDLLLKNSIFSLDRRPISDHNLIFFSFELPNCTEKPKFSPTKQIIDFDAIRVNSNFMEEISQVSSVKELIEKVSTQIAHNSRVLILSKKQQKPWVNRQLLDLMNTRDKFYKLKQKYPTNSNYLESFKELKYCIRNLIRELKTTYYCDKLGLQSSDSKKIWQTTKEIIYNQSGPMPQKPIALLIDGQLKTSPTEVSNALNNHFITVSDGIADQTQVSFPNSYPSYRNINPMDLMNTTEEEISTIISQMNSSAANGFDGISVKFLKYFSTNLPRSLLA